MVENLWKRKVTYFSRYFSFKGPGEDVNYLSLHCQGYFFDDNIARITQKLYEKFLTDLELFGLYQAYERGNIQFELWSNEVKV